MNSASSQRRQRAPFFLCRIFCFVCSFSLSYCFASSSNNDDKKKSIDKKNKIENERIKMSTFIESTLFSLSLCILILLHLFSFDNNCCFYFQILRYDKTNVNDKSCTTTNDDANSFWFHTTTNSTWITTISRNYNSIT